MALAMAALCGSARAESLLDAGQVDYSIMSADGRVTLGHGRYTIDHEKDAIVLHGESRYTSGDYDIETSVLSPGLAGGLPSLLKFDHVFYSAEGAITRASRADVTAGTASCVDTIAQIDQSKTLEFPPNTWAGASVLIPIQQFLQSGGAGDPMQMNVFNCTGKPAIYAVTVDEAARATAWPYPSNEVQVNVKPHFGWYDMFLAPFIPKLNAWFDPSHGLGFEGVAIARYYKGPQVLIVRNASEPTGGSMQVLVPTPMATGSPGATDGASVAQPNP